jgi:chromosome segregation ATPase
MATNNLLQSFGIGTGTKEDEDEDEDEDEEETIELESPDEERMRMLDQVEDRLKAEEELRRRLRSDFKDDNRDDKRKLRRNRRRLEGATGTDAKEIRAEIESTEEIVSEREEQISNLTTQMTAIKKRMPKLEKIRMDLRTSVLGGDSNVIDTIDNLHGEMAGNPTELTSGEQLQQSLVEIDDLAQQVGMPGQQDASVAPSRTDAEFADMSGEEKEETHETTTTTTTTN